MKDTNMSEIENDLCLGSVMNVTPVFQIERELWGASSIIRKVNYGVYICSCSVISDEYRCKEKDAFVYDSHFKYFHQSEYCGDLIDNRAYAPVFVLRDNSREKKLNLKHPLKISFVDCGLCNMSTKQLHINKKM